MVCETQITLWFDSLYIRCLSLTPQIVQENHYTPFGNSISDLDYYAGTDTSDYLYNGKELQRETNYLDYGARQYDPQIGRWHTIDPKSEDYYSFSPYNYTLNNPINLIDPDGMAPTDWVRNNKTGKYEWRNEVTSASNTPSGYSYVGKQDNDILKDLGWAAGRSTISSGKIGYIASDAENEGPVSYAVNHMVKVDLKTSLTVKAEVSLDIDLKADKFSKEFLGVSLGITNVSKNSGTDEITATGNAGMTFNGKKYSTTLTSVGEGHITETGASVSTGNILIPASQLSQGATLPSVNVKGGWWNFKDDGSGATPLVHHPLAPVPKSYNHEFKLKPAK